MIHLENQKAYNTRETAAILEVAPQTVRNYVSTKRLKAEVINRAFFITESSLKEFAKKRG